MRVVIIGSNGQLGTDLVRVFNNTHWQVVGLTNRDIEVKDESRVIQILGKYNPQIVINTAAFHDLVACEQNPQEAMMVNAMGVLYLAKWCSGNEAILAHLSTDYVFGGNADRSKPYVETDAIAPQSAYAISKAAGELLLRLYAPRNFLIRTSGLFGTAGSFVKGTNFVDQRVEQMKRGETVHMVDDQVLSPTFTLNLAQTMEKLIGTKKYGVYHMVSHGQCSWYQFTVEIKNLLGLDVQVVAVKTNDNKSGVVRPRYSVLKNENLKKIGVDYMNPWRKNLRLYLEAKGWL